GFPAWNTLKVNVPLKLLASKVGASAYLREKSVVKEYKVARILQMQEEPMQRGRTSKEAGEGLYFINDAKLDPLTFVYCTMGDAVDFTLFNILSLILPPISEMSKDLEAVQINERRIINTVLDPKIYDASVPYKPPAEVVPVFSLHHVENVDEVQQLMVLHGAMLLMWKDKRLAWNVSEYGNIREINRRRSQLVGRIWLPKLYLTEIFFRTANILGSEGTELTIIHTGLVRCKVKILVKTSCYFEYDEYPNDHQNCSFTMYTPFTIDKMKFTEYGGADKSAFYRSRAGKAPSKVDIGDFILERIDSRSLNLLAGSKIVGNVEKYPAKMVRSVYWYNLVFRRHNIYYVTRMAVPLFTISCLTYAFCLLRSHHGLIWLLLSLAVQIMNGAILMENLPPDYTKMPAIGLTATLVLFETICLIIWRFFTVSVIQTLPDRPDLRSKIDLVENFLCVYFVIRIIHIYMKLF
ncbi:Neurotransmitter-gated ion-channel ligand binding domain protein, partial [Trichostrongylus colubriformis]